MTNQQALYNRYESKLNRKAKLSRIEFARELFGADKNKSNLYNTLTNFLNGTARQFSIDLLRKFCEMTESDPNELIYGVKDTPCAVKYRDRYNTPCESVGIVTGYGKGVTVFKPFEGREFLIRKVNIESVEVVEI